MMNPGTEYLHITHGLLSSKWQSEVVKGIMPIKAWPYSNSNSPYDDDENSDY